MISPADGSDVIRWGQERARAGPWQGDPHVAYLVPLPGGPAPSVGFVSWAMDQLSARGFSRVVTNALSPMEQVAFLGAGFEVQERLHLLSHDLRHLSQARSSKGADADRAVCEGHRRARPDDHGAVLELDARAFPRFWHLDQRGLEDAVRATPRTRFRVVTRGGAVIAYALTGRTRRRGFLQRLAVDPAHQRQGLGGALVIDALRWLRLWGSERAAVNTPTGNQAALSLYQGLGFRCEPRGLSVLTAGLQSGSRSRPWAEGRERSDR